MRSRSFWIPVVLVLGAALALAEPPPDELWAKALELSAANKDQMPGLIKVKVEELDKKNRVESVMLEETRLFLGEDGKLATELIRATEDGEDVTEKRRQEESSVKTAEDEEDDGGSQSMSAELGPFDPDQQGTLHFERTGRRQVLDGRECLAYQYTQELEEDGETVTIAGTAWLDAETGAPRSMTYAPDPLPSFVKKMDNRLGFATDENGGWRLTEMVTEVNAGMLFIRKNLRLTVEFQDHWRMPEDATPEVASEG